jgi:hypothetical protein
LFKFDNQIAKYFNQGGILSQEMRGEINKRLRDLYEMKYKVPNDFSVCGFDNVPMADMNRISLTTVEHSIEAKVMEMAGDFRGNTETYRK